jgi:GntR family transcriptional regulator, transcriptional repressor for pyruvate dehydrogenase complex
MIKELVKRKTLSEEVVACIKQYIIDNSLTPGDRLPTEQEFSDRLGVSRTSIREATKALSFLGILRSAPKVGLTVGNIDMARVMEYLGFHFALSHYPVERLFKARIVIEIGALYEVMERMKCDSELYNRLTKINEDLNRVDNEEDFIRYDQAFHYALVKASDIEPLVDFNDLLQVFFKRFRKCLRKENFKPGFDNHQSLIRALRDGKLQTAENILRNHLEPYRNCL